MATVSSFIDRRSTAATMQKATMPVTQRSLRTIAASRSPVPSTGILPRFAITNTTSAHRMSSPPRTGSENGGDEKPTTTDFRGSAAERSTIVPMENHAGAWGADAAKQVYGVLQAATLDAPLRRDEQNRTRAAQNCRCLMAAQPGQAHDNEVMRFLQSPDGRVGIKRLDRPGVAGQQQCPWRLTRCGHTHVGRRQIEQRRRQ
jgi:hypothetical protein